MSTVLGSGLRLTLYGRRYCHLCDDMIHALEPLRVAHGFELDVLDVDSRPEWEQRFGELVPVLLHGDTEICHYFLDRQALTAYLARFR